MNETTIPSSIASRSLLKLFPIPRYLSMPSVGLDLSDRSVRFLELIPEENGFVVGKYGERVIPEGVMTVGEISNREKLKEILVGLRKDYDLHFIRVGLPEEKAYLFKTEVPSGTPEEVYTNLESQLEENVPISPAEAVFDYDHIKTESPSANHLSVSVSVIPQKIVNDFSSIFIEAGLAPLSFEIEAQAIARSVVATGDYGTYMIVDFGKTHTGLSVKSEGVIRYTSTIEIGGLALTKALEKAFNLSTEEAEKKKKEKGLDKAAENRAVFDSLLTAMGAWRDEINKHFMYWHTTSKDQKKAAVEQPIQKIILCGGDANLAGLCEYLSSTMKVKVELANVWENVFQFEKHIPTIRANDSLRYATAIGLALRFY